MRIETNRLIIKSNISVINGRLQELTSFSEKVSLLNLTPNNPEDGGFISYNKGTKEMVCRIEFTRKRNRTELTYITEEPHQRKGYISESMAEVIKWICENSKETELWLLIGDGNSASQRVARKFNFIKTSEKYGEENWYRRVLRTDISK